MKIGANYSTRDPDKFRVLIFTADNQEEERMLTILGEAMSLPERTNCQLRRAGKDVGNFDIGGAVRLTEEQRKEQGLAKG